MKLTPVKTLQGVGFIKLLAEALALPLYYKVAELRYDPVGISVSQEGWTHQPSGQANCVAQQVETMVDKAKELFSGGFETYQSENTVLAVKRNYLVAIANVPEKIARLLAVLTLYSVGANTRLNMVTTHHEVLEYPYEEGFSVSGKWFSRYYKVPTVHSKDGYYYLEQEDDPQSKYGCRLHIATYNALGLIKLLSLAYGNCAVPANPWLPCYGTLSIPIEPGTLPLGVTVRRNWISLIT